MNYFKFIIFLLCALTIQSTSSYALDIQKIRFGLHSDKTRMVVEINEQTQFHAFMLPEIKDKPYRLVVDLPNFNWKAGTIKRPPKTTILDVRSGVVTNGTRRLVIDLEEPAQLLKAFLLPANGKNSHRLVVDYKTITKAQFATTKRATIGTLSTSSTEASSPAPQKPSTNNNALNNALGQLIAKQFSTETDREKTTASPQKQSIVLPTRKPTRKASAPQKTVPPKTSTATKTKSPLRKPLIVIDAGHGGQDPGAVGKEKQREKKITLSTAKILKDKLEKTGRYRVALTRSTDKYLKLYKRVSIARNKDADLFISLHADSIGKSNVRGASIYTLSNKASDAQTAKLARRENQADLIAGVNLSHEDKDVANILIDLAMRDTMNQSKFFANTVVTHMRARGMRILPRPHRYAGFAVLKAPDIPSVLVEMGFMSNKSEARLLTTTSYQQKIASTLTDSIDSYFQKVKKNNL